MVSARTWRVSACRRGGPYGESEIEEADRSSSGQKEYNLAAFVHGSFCPGNGGGALHLGHSVLGKNESGLENGTMNEKLG